VDNLPQRFRFTSSVGNTYTAHKTRRDKDKERYLVMWEDDIDKYPIGMIYKKRKVKEYIEKGSWTIIEILKN